ncbi:MAG TPA: signal peptidase II [Stellaceae bacterium]|nr:signal peptidase II [Stellaceae bacterium]
MSRPLAAGLAVAAAVLVADQVTKWAVLAHFATADAPVLPVMPSLNIVLVTNHGVSFGMFNTGTGWRPWVFSGIAVVIVGVLAHLLRTARSRLVVAGMGLIIGGAVGNLIDRLRFGSVVDFVDFFIGEWHWYVFNAADAAICVGVGLLLLDGLLVRPESPKA